MKRSWLVLPVLLLMAAAPFRVQSIMQKALQNERDAVAKYEACALKATEEGYAGAAALFRAAARAEGVHAQLITEAMRVRGITVPEPTPGHPAIGSTADNLRSAAMAEAQERDTTYREALEAATDAKDQELVTLFDHTRDTEVEHANLFSAALRQLDGYKQPKHFYVCDKCGYTTDIDLPLCALCRTRAHPHEVE
ncbi:MAG: ferritin family protein [Thermoanaerobaculia bacterium]